ncbi:hypothetical protein RJ639_021556 [Escallonia herrerae]|uniref:Retrotransposon Copia-like N-terminal domain-containing protein n=1 Tax=Escallonia herrerae TaxID=1293975 RepID=A0AA89AFY3_9ASTE|nr:hypothetical protein RJ639_021556 [Escallonia herrerae]
MEPSFICCEEGLRHLALSFCLRRIHQKYALPFSADSALVLLAASLVYLVSACPPPGPRPTRTAKTKPLPSSKTPQANSTAEIACFAFFKVMEDESASYVHGGLAPVANVQNIAIDTKSPFYLHPSDHPGLIFVTQPLSENGENYFTWRRNMLTALQSKNKAGFVDGLIAKPDVHSRDFQSWI